MPKLLAVALVGLFLGSSCIGIPPVTNKTGMGSIFSDLTEHLDGVSTAAPNKKGEACSIIVLGVVAIGDSSIDTARKNGGISRIAYIDRKWFNVIWVAFGRNCTIVYGE
ncbi:MAG: TRL-like family protein [Leptospiraceae bacterium]|nr:TRL-like family protein [Leptospiraceae bacterium]MDW7975473.1 TRL-like family protein [Leptospiraceae bacterium]